MKKMGVEGWDRALVCIRVGNHRHVHAQARIVWNPLRSKKSSSFS